MMVDNKCCQTVRDKVYAELDQLKEMMRGRVGPVESYDTVAVDKKVSEMEKRMKQI